MYFIPTATGADASLGITGFSSSVPLLIGLWAQFRVSGAFRKWGAVRASSNITGAEAAREILQAANIGDVECRRDERLPRRSLRPDEQTALPFDQCLHTPSVAALGIAAHETGHAIQHAKAYAPLKARMTIVPVTSIASRILPFAILGGLFSGSPA